MDCNFFSVDLFQVMFIFEIIIILSTFHKKLEKLKTDWVILIEYGERDTNFSTKLMISRMAILIMMKPSTVNIVDVYGTYKKNN